MSKNPDCNGCFYQEVDPRDGPCNSCFATAKYVHRDVFKDVDDNPVFKESYDTVNKPKHYMLFEDKGIEVRDVIEKLVLKLKQADNCVPLWEKGAMFEADYVQMMQYGMRFMDKNGVEDLKKMRWYLDKMIAAYE
jgi:hypothetical protein